MDLWIVRHAIAEDRYDGDDARRALTEEGRRRFARCVRGLKRLGAGFDLVLHSPLLRAQETADLLLPLSRKARMRVTGGLARDPDEQLLGEIRGERVAVVGHEPWLSQLAAWLVFGWHVYEDEAQAGLIVLRKGAVAHLVGEPQPGRMSLVGLHQPAALRALGRR